MKSLKLYFFVVLQTWRSINCEAEYEIEDPVSAISLNDNIGRTDFVDPYSFDYDRATKQMGNAEPAKSLGTEDTRISVGGGCKLELEECKGALNNFELERLFMKRLINLLLSNANFKEDGDSIRGSITLSGTKEEIEKLQQYGDGKISLRQIDAILTEVMTPSIDILGEALSLIEHLNMAIYRYGGIIAAISAAIAVLLSMKFVNWSTGKVVVIFLALVFLTSYFMIWAQLIKNAEIRNLMEMKKQNQPPVQCEPEKMSTWDRILTYYNGGDQCFEYYKTMDFNPYHEVNPLDVLNEIFDKILLQSFTRFGSGIGDFINNSTKHLGYPMQWIVTILLYIGLIGFLIVMPFSIFGSSFGLSLGPFFRLSIGEKQRNHINQQQQQLQQQPQQQAIVERREPITVILQLNSTEGQGQSSTNSTKVASIEDTKLSIAGGGDFKSSKRVVDGENSGGSCEKCCCKETSSSSDRHLKEILDLKNESTRSELQRDEKGDGDCLNR